MTKTAVSGADADRGAPPGILPLDAHNLRLLANVHPADWKNPEPAPRYNLVVLGAGTAGLISAAVAAGLGAKVALVERFLMGGDCLNIGCVPSKSVIRAGRLIEDARRAGALGAPAFARDAVDFGAAMQRMRRIRAQISSDDSALRFRDELKVDVFLGEARFTSRDSIEVGGRSLRFAKAVIATGARPALPPIPGLAQARPRTNETIFELTERPRRLVVIGGGPIGAELAQAFCRLGCEVTLVEAGPRLLPREDADAAEIVQRRLAAEGVSLRLGASALQVELRGNAKALRLRGADGDVTELLADEILIAVGRLPNLEGLNLETAGVEADARAGVRVNDHLQTSNPRIYAAGDICMDWKFTHAADAAAKIAVQNALFLRTKRLSSLVMPWCTYTDPEIAHVGLYEREAAERGIAVDTYLVPLDQVNRAVTDGEEEGFIKVHVKRGSDRILGATIVAAHAGEMISEVTLAIVGKLGLGTLLGVIHPYPTQAEGIKRVAGLWVRTRATPLVKRALSGWMALRRGR
jgi:pyruvate/2-oxoglutarate dehydrogenase complex dihydrolipoamide dehydrogenase (E3) component